MVVANFMGKNVWINTIKLLLSLGTTTPHNFFSSIKEQWGESALDADKVLQLRMYRYTEKTSMRKIDIRVSERGPFLNESLIFVTSG